MITKCQRMQVTLTLSMTLTQSACVNGTGQGRVKCSFFATSNTMSKTASLYACNIEDISSRFSSNSQAFTSELSENLEETFPRL